MKWCLIGASALMATHAYAQDLDTGATMLTPAVTIEWPADNQPLAIDPFKIPMGDPPLAATPEPATWALVMTGLGALAWRRK